MSAKSQQDPTKHVTREEQEAADKAKAEKKAQTDANRKARQNHMKEAMKLGTLLGIGKEAFKYTTQGRCPEPEVIAATFLLVLTLVQNIIKECIEVKEKKIGAVAVMKAWRRQA